MYAFTYHHPSSVLRGARRTRRRGRQAAGRWPDADPDHEAAARLAGLDHRSRRDRRTRRRQPRRRFDRDRRDDAPRRRRRQSGRQAAIPALAALAHLIGDPAVRNRGTIGGSIANNDPAADYPAASLALGATIVTDKRQIAAGRLFQGPVRDGAGGPGNHHGGPLPDSRRRRPTRSSAIRPRATRLVGVFVAKTKGGVRVDGDGRGEQRSVSRPGVRVGARQEFRRFRARRPQRAGERPRHRLACRRRLSRAPDRRPRQAGRRGSGGGEGQPLLPLREKVP